MTTKTIDVYQEWINVTKEMDMKRNHWYVFSNCARVPITIIEEETRPNNKEYRGHILQQFENMSVKQNMAEIYVKSYEANRYGQLAITYSY
jgi:hypothetical protein